MENKSSTDVANTAALPTPRPPAPSPKAPRPATPQHKLFTPKEVKAGIETCTQKFRNTTRFHSDGFLRARAENKYHAVHMSRPRPIHELREQERKGDFNTSLHQPAMPELLLNGLTKDEGTKVYFQDPVFTRSERDQLQSRGHTVLHDDDAFAKMSKTAFLFAPDLKAKNISRALTDPFPALYIDTDPDAAIADIGKDDAKEFPGGKEKCFRPLQGFGRDSAETLRLPIFTHGVRDGRGVWAEASVRWRVPDGGGRKVGKWLGGGDGKSRSGNRSATLSSGAEGKENGKGKEFVIDYRGWDP